MREALLTEPENADFIHNLTSFILAGARKISVGRAYKDSDQLVRVGINSDDPRLETVSRDHGNILYHPELDTFIFQNLSRNGSRINDDLYQAGGGATLKDGDVIYLGDYPLKFSQKESRRKQSDTRILMSGRLPFEESK